MSTINSKAGMGLFLAYTLTNRLANGKDGEFSQTLAALRKVMAMKTLDTPERRLLLGLTSSSLFMLYLVITFQRNYQSKQDTKNKLDELDRKLTLALQTEV